MAQQMQTSSGWLPSDVRYDRRRKTRIRGPIPARVQGVDASGQSFDVRTDLEDLSAGGLFVRLQWWVEQGAPLMVSFRVPAAPGMDQIGTHWATQGVVRRVAPRAPGSCGVGVEFTSYSEFQE